MSRRGFLTAAGATAAAVGAPGALASVAGAHGGSRHGHYGNRIPRDRISIQLYTLRDQLAIDFQGTLNAVRSSGYRRVEHAGFVGRTATQFKAASTPRACARRPGMSGSRSRLTPPPGRHRCRTR